MKKIVSIKIVHRPDDVRSGDYIGIVAEATIQTGTLLNTLTSGGLWAVESDSDLDYLAEIGAEQLDELDGVLLELGFSEQAINRALGQVTVPR